MTPKPLPPLRHCTVCGVELPRLVAFGPRAGEPDTFPRCSPHAF